MPNPSRNGFTLIELLIVVMIIALLMGLALPSFQEYFEKARLRGAADDVVALLAEARQSAVRQSKQVRMRFGGGANDWCVGGNVADDPDADGKPIPLATACACNTTDSCSLLRPRGVPLANIPADQKRRVLAANYRGVTRKGAAPVDFTFDPIMGARNDLNGGTFLELLSSSGRYALQVQMTATGQARACRSAGTDGITRVITGYRECAP